MRIEEYIKLIAELAQEVAMEDPIDWADLPMDEKSTFDLLASSVVETLSGHTNEVLLAIIIKLTVENFVLHYKSIESNVKNFRLKEVK